MASSTIEPTRSAVAPGCPFAGSRTASRIAGPRRTPVPSAVRTSTAVPDFPADALGLARAVSRQVRESGKHVLPPSLLHAMVLLRGRPDRFVVAFLDCLLDKHDGRFHNRTYLALGLLELILADPRGVPDRERLSALLMADVIRHETAVAATPPRADDDRPDARTLGARLAHARRFVAECGVPEGAALPVPPDGVVGEWFAMTAQPVSVVHDEYFFLRALQCHELVFTGLAENVVGATAALREGDVRSAREQVERAVAAFARRRCCSGSSRRCGQRRSTGSASSPRAPAPSSRRPTNDSRSRAGGRRRSGCVLTRSGTWRLCAPSPSPVPTT